MKKWAYYNENDAKAAAWIRELIRCGLVAPGEVDERDIQDVRPDDVRPFAQCHWFAGIAVWSYALRRAGWPDDRPVWTGSCPCQPFSAAGKGGGFDDERHLWPAWHWLIQQCRPGVVFGEQVASKDGLDWLDLVQADMERAGYAIGALDLCAAGVGAPHIRQRLYFVADAESIGRIGRADDGDAGRRERAFGLEGEAGGLADSDGWHAGAERKQRSGEQRQPARSEQSGVLGDRPGPVNGLWRDSDWLHCTDGKWRPVESGTFPLAYGLPSGLAKISPEFRRMVEVAGLDGRSLRAAKKHRVSTLRGAGNAIAAPLAQTFVESYLDARGAE